MESLMEGRKIASMLRQWLRGRSVRKMIFLSDEQ